ncbi:hypothetical protein ASPCAL06484 [Aspergillus calidoustus]|uniref:Uncharacterized protein n=1 Tax=Aspergillus calidoustus TaxID=454130 RepID=A0A0U5G158_ASPCI|nr:hypothetical protein ASPCAL06484 [Aspergillus calidoustus]
MRAFQGQAWKRNPEQYVPEPEYRCSPLNFAHAPPYRDASQSWFLRHHLISSRPLPSGPFSSLLLPFCSPHSRFHPSAMGLAVSQFSVALSSANLSSPSLLSIA